MGLSVAVRSLGYCVAEAPLFATEWGIKHIKSNSNDEILERTRELLHWERPDVVVIENYAGEGSRRSRRMQEVIKAIVALAISLGIIVKAYSRGVIRECFASFGAYTKYEIATVLARMVPCLRSKLPRRKPRAWENEPRAMALFDAAALLMAHYKLGGWSP